MVRETDQVAAPRVGNHVARVSRKDVIADGVVRLQLTEPGGGRLPDWNPGAHIDLALPVDGSQSLIRQYSLCGDRWNASTYEIAVLREPASRGGSEYVHDGVEVGDLLAIGTPRNNFGLAPARGYQFIAGGIGITPIMTMIAAAEQLGTPWRLLYGGRSRRSMAFLEELSRYGDRVTICPQDEQGLLDLGFLAEPVAFTKIYCCGPTPLLDAVGAAAGRWPTQDVRFERFVAAVQAPPVRSGPFTIVLAHSGLSLTVQPDESILDVLSRAGVRVVSSCQEGVCGTCEVRVLGGTPDHRDSLLSDSERARNDRMFACVSRSADEQLVLDL